MWPPKWYSLGPLHSSMTTPPRQTLPIHPRLLFCLGQLDLLSGLTLLLLQIHLQKKKKKESTSSSYLSWVLTFISPQKPSSWHLEHPSKILCPNWTLSTTTPFPKHIHTQTHPTFPTLVYQMPKSETVRSASICCDLSLPSHSIGYSYQSYHNIALASTSTGFQASINPHLGDCNGFLSDVPRAWNKAYHTTGPR